MKHEILKDQFNLSAGISNTATKTKGTPQFKGILYEQLDDGFGNPLLRKVSENTVTVGGAIESLEHLCKKNASWKPQTLNQLYNLNEDIPGTPFGSVIALFGVGNEGCGDNWGSVVEKDIKNHNLPGLIPLRCGSVITGSESGKYYFKKANEDGSFSWYLKEFDQEIEIKSCWKNSLADDEDGTEITEDIHGNDNTDGIQTFAEFVLHFNTEDVREWYDHNNNIDDARYNSIGLFIGEKVTLTDGTEDYVNVRLFSYLNIDNKSVREKTASTYVYRILSLV